MTFEQPEYYETRNGKTWRRTIQRAIERGDLAQLAKCIQALTQYVKANDSAALQQKALTEARRELKSLLDFKVTELCRLLDTYPWPSEAKFDIDSASVDIRRLQHEISEACPKYKDYGKKEYLALRTRLLEDNGPLAEFLADEFDGYASDDSDEEADDDEDDDDEEPVKRPPRVQWVKRGTKVTPRVGGNVMERIPAHLRNNPFAPLLVADEVLNTVEQANRLPNYLRLQKARKPTFRSSVHDPDPDWVRGVAWANLQRFWNKQLSADELHTENAQIQHGLDWTQQVEADFKLAQAIFAELNAVEASPKADAEAKEKARQGAKEKLDLLKTKFCFAQYRGITYKTSAFDRSARHASRETVEVGQPIYCMSVFKAAGVNPADYFAGRCPEEDLRRLDTLARQLRAVLVQKRSSGEITYLNYAYDSHAHALQDVYTNNYDYFHSAIQVHFAEKFGWTKRKWEEAEKSLSQQAGWDKKPKNVQEGLIRKKVYGFNPPENGEIYDGLLNAECPFVSTGDVPRHALKYAYGKKFYLGHKHERLLSRWNPDGRAERPYCGKVYVTLHGLSELIDDAPLHVRSLNNTGRIKVASDIALERETTFPAFIPADRLVIEHIAKIPSFPNERAYSDLYLTKYGITKEEFAEYYKAIRTPAVQEKAYGMQKNPKFREPPKEGVDDRAEDEREKEIEKTGGTYINLDSWLVNYHEVRLIELARQVARSRGQILVYRDEAGELSRELPVPVSKETEALREEKKKRTQGKRSFDREMIQLKKRIQGESLKSSVESSFNVKSTAGDGNCLFRALSAALAHVTNGATQVTHQQLRLDICGVYSRSAQLRQQQRINQQYLENMQQPARSALDVSRWGSDAEIIAFTELYPNIRVRVFSPTYPAPGYYADFEKFGRQIDMTIRLLHQGGNHWTWLVQKGG